VWYGGYALDCAPKQAPRAVAMAKSHLSDVHSRIANRALQMHGGIGFTWEHDLHFWYKRAAWNHVAFGDPQWHRERLAELASFAA
jgi:alkylation response protein AidB-like acyl-CoA dehydrogenase